METAHKLALAIGISLLVIFSSFTFIALTVHADEINSSSWQKAKENDIRFSTSENASTEFLPQFKYYKEIVFSNATTGSQVISFIVHQGEGKDTSTDLYVNCTNFPADIRFALSPDSTNYLPQYIEHTIDIANNQIIYTNPTRIFVKVPADVTKIYMLYGSSTAELYSNGTAVFDYFDDFTNSTVFLNDYTVQQQHGSVTFNSTLGFVKLYLQDGSQSVVSLINNKVSFDPLSDANKKLVFYAKFSLLTDTLPYPYGGLGFINSLTPSYSDNSQRITFDPSAASTIRTNYPGATASVNNPGIQTGSDKWYDVKLIYKESGEEWYYFSHDAQNFVFVYDNTVAETSQSAYHPGAVIKMYNSATYSFIIDYMAAYESYVNAVNVTSVTTQTNDSSGGDNGTGGAGGAGVDTGSSGWLSTIEQYILSHLLTIVFAALAVISAFGRNGKAFILFAALAGISYFYLDTYIAQYFAGG